MTGGDGDARPTLVLFDTYVSIAARSESFRCDADSTTFLADDIHLRLLSRRTSTVALFVGMRESNVDPNHDRRALRQRSEIVFEYVPGPFEITPDLAKVLLRILRKAAERRGIDINDIDTLEALTSQPS